MGNRHNPTAPPNAPPNPVVDVPVNQVVDAPVNPAVPPNLVVDVPVNPAVPPNPVVDVPVNPAVPPNPVVDVPVNPAVPPNRNHRNFWNRNIVFKHPTITMSEAELAEVLCAVCYKTGASLKRHRLPVGVTNCGHRFCMPCICKWKKTRPFCPMCEQHFVGKFKCVHII